MFVYFNRLDNLVVEYWLRVCQVTSSIPEKDRVISKMVKQLYQYFPYLAIKHWLFLK